MLPRELIAQLCDEADNPTAEENVRVTLIRDGAFKVNDFRFQRNVMLLVTFIVTQCCKVTQ